ncbi:hypothetical protein PR048_026562 [Dryococelus australis]|uniref:Uncharacterized protein n=1 Tax=Dryococelus australis TaxID=614101 RepID=A0ABQ9GLP6_9NEOP|nr:hypothetical protein PR048_026562 [Dryococelus australis]
MEYRVSLPDHDWMVAEHHKLIPSVFAGIEIKPITSGNPHAVGYSGPTFLAIRSGKHNSTANAHALDIEALLNVDEFQSLARTEDGSVKPVVIMTVVEDRMKIQGVSQSRVRPVRIQARCDNELMCILQAQNGDEDVEKLEKEEVEAQGLETSNIPAHCSSEKIIIDNVETWIQVSWTSD